MGDSRRLFATHFLMKADAYFHNGYYPGIFDEAKSFDEAHIAEETTSKEIPTRSEHAHAENEQEHAEDNEAEHGFLGEARDWIDRFSRHFYPSVHSHRDDKDTEHEQESGPAVQRADVREMLDHATYYFPVGRRHAFDRLRFGGHRIHLRDLAVRNRRTLTECRAALDKAGVRVAVVDVTSLDVSLGPFRVVRAVSPDLQGLSFGFGLERQPVSRIKQRLVKTLTDRVLPPIHPIW